MTKYIVSLCIIFSAFLAVPAGAVTKAQSWIQPVLNLPKATLATWVCILHNESRSTLLHPNLGDNNPYGSSGIFQIEQRTWAAHQLAAGVPKRIHVWQATPLQQSLVAVAIWKADGFSPWRFDGCI